jgi:predicted outer membrane repeat protein
MSSLLLFVRTAWDDYFTGNPTNHSSQTYTSRQTPSGTSVYISNCLFDSFTSTSDGGALYCTSVTYFLVESSSFFSCKTSSSYGAIYNSGSQSVLHMVCGYDCCSTSSNHYQFGYIRVNNAATSKNYFNYTSIVRCVNENSDLHYILYPGYGKIFFQSFNMSMNKCGNRLLYCDPFRDANSVTLSFSYSSIADHIISGYTCIRLWAVSINDASIFYSLFKYHYTISC